MSALATHVEDLLLDFAYGELPDREARAVETHLASCPQCKASLEDIQGVRKVMAKLPETDAPKDGLDSLLAYAEQAARRTQAGPAPKKTWWRALILPVAGVAAAATFFIVGQEVYKSKPLSEAVHEAAMSKAAEERSFGDRAAAPTPEAAPPPVVAQAPAPDSAKQGKRELDGLLRTARDSEEDAKKEAADDRLAYKNEELEEKQAQKPVAKSEWTGKASPSKKKEASGEGGEGALGPIAAITGGASSGAARGREQDATAGSAAGSLGGLGMNGAGPGGGGTGQAANRDEALDDSKARDAPAKVAANKPSDVVADKSPRAKEPPIPPAAPKAEANPEPKGQAESRGRADDGYATAAPTAQAPAASRSAAPSMDFDDSTAEREMPGTAVVTESTREEVGFRRMEAAKNEARAKALLDQALAANKARRYEDAVAYCRQLFALDVRQVWIRQGALNALCEAESQLTGNLSACEALVREYPSSGAAKMAKSRMTTSKANSGDTAAGAPAARPPYATEKKAASPVEAAPANAAEKQ